jgi:2-polyprenyl-3-methyl-5-hydroxy-6-metoxy-1,4-benzoquinol methylase
MDSKYSYLFDTEVMHPYMLTSFLPFFKKGNMLELGSGKGDFTQRLLPYFEDITCVDSDRKSIESAKWEEFGDGITFICSSFEDLKLSTKYENIIMTHVLEHVEDPIAILKMIKNEWLTEEGRLFLVCPNANAASRQIAVKMGLIKSNTAVTPQEENHGHKRTYSFDSLGMDVMLSGMRVSHCSGIFFKVLANFQWDRAIAEGIVSAEYLEGCYQFGKEYPDLCSSIFLLCERG